LIIFCLSFREWDLVIAQVKASMELQVLWIFQQIQSFHKFYRMELHCSDFEIEVLDSRNLDWSQVVHQWKELWVIFLHLLHQFQTIKLALISLFSRDLIRRYSMNLKIFIIINNLIRIIIVHNNLSLKKKFKQQIILLNAPQAKGS